MNAYNIKSQKELDLLDNLSSAAKNSPFSMKDILHNFTVYTSRQTIARFLNRYEMYKQIINIHGSILEFGVYKGCGAFAWQHFASIIEPYNINRKIYAFDTFEGFPEISEKDPDFYRKNDLNDASYQEMVQLVAIHQENMPLSHISHMTFIKGDICQTLPSFLEENPQLIAALVYVDVDIYKPTKTILQCLLKRIPKGGIIAFDELNDIKAKGETVALLEELDISKYEIKRNSFDSNPCYLIMA
jgi:hypothetical protein